MAKMENNKQVMLVEWAVKILMERWDLDFDATVVQFDLLARELGVAPSALAPIVISSPPPAGR